MLSRRYGILHIYTYGILQIYTYESSNDIKSETAASEAKSE